MEEGDKVSVVVAEGGGGEEVKERGDEVDRRTAPLNTLTLPTVKSSVLLNVQLKVKPSNNSTNSSSIQAGNTLRCHDGSVAGTHSEPINVTLEYSPGDLEVNISAQLIKPDESIATFPALASIERAEGPIRHHVGTDANQNFHIPNESFGGSSTRLSQESRARASQSQNYQSQSTGRDLIFDKEATSNNPQLKAMEGDESLYQSVLMGNDSLFGNISIINNAATSEDVDNFGGLEVSSVGANAGSLDDLGYDVTDLTNQLYPGFEETDEALENKMLNQEDKENVGEDVAGPFILPKHSQEASGYLEKINEENQEESEVENILRDLLDKVEFLSDEDETQKRSLAIEPRSNGNMTAVQCSTKVPMKIQRTITSAPIVLRKTTRTNSHEDKSLKMEASYYKKLEKQREMGRGVPATIFTSGYDAQGIESIDVMEEGLKNKKLNWVSEPCHHGKTQHACHVCIPIPDEVVVLLEDSIGLTRTEARKAAFTFLRYLREQHHTSRVKSLMKYVSGLEVTKKRSRRQISLPVAHTREQKLRIAIQNVARQKGAWGIFEDEEVVLAHLNELNDYLTTLDKSSIKKALKDDRYQSVKALCTYFALEKRWIVRSEILNSFDLLITKDSTAFEVLTMSDLPVDLASAIKQEYMENEGGQKRIMAYAAILSSLLNSGRPLQVDHLERVNADFVYCFLQITEGNMKDGCSSSLRDTLVNIILAYNLQFGFDEMYTNKVLAALSTFKDPDYLKQKMLLFVLNKGVPQFRSEKPSFPSPSCYMVVKLATDILICHKTADFFIDSDLNIILAGVGSYITELGPGDEKRTTALRLTQLILRRLDYQHNGIRRVIQILKGIFMEKEPESRKDQKIAKRIAKEIEESAHRSRSHLTGL